MPEVEIRHNPYRVQTEIRIDGRDIGPASALNEIVNGSRLQVWVDHFIPKLKEYLNSDSADIIFHGTETDAEDIENAVTKYRSELNINLTVKPGGNPNDKIEALKALVQDADTGPVEELRNDEFKQAFNKALDPRFEISIQAPLKAGKSTFINALLGRDLLPENVDACTATIILIEDVDAEDGFTGVNIGMDEEMDEHTPARKSKIAVTREILGKWNCETNRCVWLYGKIPFVKSPNMRLVLVDTPGPNNAKNPMHRQATKDFIKRSNKTMVFYLLNIGQYESDDNEKCFQYIEESMRKGGRQSSDRIIFVVTKMDEVDRERRDVKDLIENKILRYLKDNRIENARVLPVSAKIAKIARMKRHGHALTEDEDYLLNHHLKLRRPLNLHKYAVPCTKYVEKSVKEKIDLAERNHDSLALVECHAGLATVEATIQEFIDKYALPMKIYDACQEINRQVDRFEIKAKMIRQINESAEIRKRLNEQMGKVKDQLLKGEKAEQFRERVRKLEWRATEHYGRARSEIYAKINELYRETESRLPKDKYIKPKDVEQELSPVYEKLNGLLVSLREEMEKSVREEIEQEYGKLRQEYDDYLKELLGELNLLLPKIEILMPGLPPLQILVSENTERVVVDREFVSRWYDWVFPPLMLFRRFIKKNYRDVHKYLVNKEEFLKELREELNKYPEKIESSMRSETIQAIEKLKHNMLMSMNTLDEKMKRLTAELDDLSKSNESAAEAHGKMMERKKWLDGFLMKLNRITEI